MGQLRVPSKDSAIARSGRVLLYTVGAIFLTWLSDPETVTAIAEYYPEIASGIVLFAPLLSLLTNTLRRDVDNI